MNRRVFSTFHLQNYNICCLLCSQKRHHIMITLTSVLVAQPQKKRKEAESDMKKNPLHDLMGSLTGVCGLIYDEIEEWMNTELQHAEIQDRQLYSSLCMIGFLAFSYSPV